MARKAPVKTPPALMPAPAPTPAPRNKPELLTLEALTTRTDLLTTPTALIPNFVWSGNTTLLVGRDKCGKSTCARSLIARYSNSPDAGNVLWIRVEENLTHLLERFGELGADLSKIYVFSLRNVEFEDLEEAVADIDPSIVVVDTLTTWMSEHGVTDENAASQVIPMITPFIDLAQKSEAGNLMLHHKQKEGREYRGSTAIGASVDMIITMSGKGSNERTFNTLGRFDLPDFAMTFDGTEYNYSANRAQEELTEYVLKVITNNPGLGQNELCRLIGGDHKKVKKALEELTQSGRIKNAGTRTKYQYVPVILRKTNQPQGHHTGAPHLAPESEEECGGRGVNQPQHHHTSTTPINHTEVAECGAVGGVRSTPTTTPHPNTQTTTLDKNIKEQPHSDKPRLTGRAYSEWWDAEVAAGRSPFGASLDEDGREQ